MGRGLLAGVLALALVGLAACEPGEGRYIDDTYFTDTQLVLQADVVYGEAPPLPDQSMPPGMERLLLDVVMPDPAVDAETRRPAIVWIHGGGFKAGNKSAGSTQAARWARRGFVAVTINYRLDQDNLCQNIQDGQSVPETEKQQCLDAIRAAQHDAQAAVRWLRHNADALQIDPDDIAASGSSAGAVTALNLAYNAHDPGTSNPLTESSVIGAAVVYSGAAYGQLDPNYPPVADIGPGDAPTMDAHCTNDLAVDWNLTKAGIDAAVAAGLVAEYKLWSPPEFCAPGRVHGVDLLKDHAAELNLAFTQFVYRHLELTQVED